MDDLAVDPGDPWRRAEQTVTVTRIRAYGQGEHYSEDGVLFERGDHSLDFLLILEGSADRSR